MKAVLGPAARDGELVVAGPSEVGLDGGQLLELGHEPGQRWSHDTGGMAVSLSVSTPAAAGEAPDSPAPAGGGGLAPTVQCSTVQYSTVQVVQHLPGHEVSEGEAVPRKPAAAMTPQEADTQRT